MSNYTKDVTFAKSGIDASGNITISDLAGSDATMTLSVADNSITVTLVDAASGQINFNPKPTGFGTITVTCVQDNQWPNGDAGTFIATPHPINLGEVAQISTNQTDIGSIQDHLHDPATGVDKKISDLETSVGNKADKAAGANNAANGFVVLDASAKIPTSLYDQPTASDFTDDFQPKAAGADNAANGYVKVGTDSKIPSALYDQPTASDFSNDFQAKAAGADNAANGYVKLNASGKIPTSLYDAGSGGGGSVTAQDIKDAIDDDTTVHLMTTTQKDKIDDIAEIKSVNSSLNLDENGQLSVPSQFIEDEVATLPFNKNLNEKISENSYSASKNMWIDVDDHLSVKITTNHEDFHIRYNKKNTHYPDNVELVYSYDSKTNQGKQDGSSYGVIFLGDGQNKKFTIDTGFNNGEVEKKGHWIKLKVALVSVTDGTQKFYSFKFNCHRDGRYRLEDRHITGKSLSNNLKEYNK